MARTIDGIDGMKALVGQQVAASDWHLVTQDQVDRFADATGDHQWIHVDPEAAKAGPFGRTIAHGYLTLSLAPVLLAQALVVQGVSMAVNYGINRLRFPAPLPVGEKVRLLVGIAELEEFEGGATVTLDLTFEVEGQAKPCCVAQVLYRYYR